MICNALQWYHAQNYINLPISYEAEICGETSEQQNTAIPTCHFAFTMCQEPKNSRHNSWQVCMLLDVRRFPS